MEAAALTERERSLSGGGPLVTVVVPTFNRADLLVQAVQSIIDQTYRNWELFVVEVLSV
ncbi:MAG: glycosyltransferase [Sphingomonadales bacterium]